MAATETNDDIMALLAEAEEVTKPGEAPLHELSGLIEKMRRLEAEKAELDTKSAELGRQLSELAEREIPMVMDQLRFAELPLADGKKLVLRQTYVGKIPEDKREEAFAWLEANNLSGIIKTSVEALFGAGQFEKAKALAARLGEDGYVVNAERSVHSQTLGKFVKDSLTSGREIPTDLFNPSVLRRAKIV